MTPKRSRTVAVGAVATLGITLTIAFLLRPKPDPFEIAVAQQPRIVAPGARFAVIVVARDVTRATVDWSGEVELSAAGAALSGTVRRRAVKGVATFDDLSIETPVARCILTARAGALSATSDAFPVDGTPTKLGFTIEPRTCLAGTGSPFHVAVQDAQGTTVLSATNLVSLEVHGPEPMTFALPASGGVAPFKRVKLPRPGKYTIVATSPGLATARSRTFDVVAPLLPSGSVTTSGRMRSSTGRYSQDASATFDVFEPEATGSGRRALVLIHGGAWTSGEKEWCRTFVDKLVGAGYVCFSVNYRLAPSARWPAQLEDCQGAIRYFRENADKYGIDRGKIAALGVSAGGHLAAMLALRPDATGARLKVAVDIAGDADLSVAAFENQDDVLRKVLGALAPERIRDISPVNFVRSDVSILLVHDELDSLLRVDQSDRLFAALHDAGADVGYFRPVRKLHAELIEQPDVLSLVLEFLEKRL